jgi:hypothetical protein
MFLMLSLPPERASRIHVHPLHHETVGVLTALIPSLRLRASPLPVGRADNDVGLRRRDGRPGHGGGHARLGGAFAPTIAQALVQSTGSAVSVGVYIVALAAVSIIAVSLVREPRGVDLRI